MTVLIYDIGALVHFVSGFMADVFGAMVWTPMDIIKQRQVGRGRGWSESNQQE